MEDQILDYIHYIKFEKRLSNETIKNYKYDLNHFKLFLLSNKIANFNGVKQIDIEDYLVVLNKEKDPSSVARNMVTVNNLFNYLIIEKIIDKNPCEFISRPKLRKKLPNVLSEAEVDNL